MKKESRILGISSPNRPMDPVPVVGVIFRGNLWLDGVITSVLNPTKRDYLSGLAMMIIESKQYSQIHAVILAKAQLVANATTNVNLLAAKTHLPVMIIKRKNIRHERFTRLACKPLGPGGPTVSLSRGCTLEFAREVFKVGCAKGRRIPEAVRVANLVASRISPSFVNQKSSNA